MRFNPVLLIMVIKATIIKVLFAEMYVNVLFVMFVQRCELNSGERIALYKNYYYSLFIITAAVVREITGQVAGCS